METNWDKFGQPLFILIDKISDFVMFVQMDDIKKYLTVLQVAKKLDYTEEWVRDLIKAKELTAVKIGKQRIRPEELEKFINSRTNL